MFGNDLGTEFSGFGVTFHGSRLLLHAPGTLPERTGYSKWLKTTVCAMYLRFLCKAHKRFRDGKSDQGIMKRTRQSLKSIEKVIPNIEFSTKSHPEGCSFDDLAKLVHDFEVTFHISGATFARNPVIPG